MHDNRYNRVTDCLLSRKVDRRRPTIIHLLLQNTQIQQRHESITFVYEQYVFDGVVRFNNLYREFSSMNTLRWELTANGREHNDPQIHGRKVYTTTRSHEESAVEKLDVTKI